MTQTTNLSIVRAGAGSGKTYEVTRWLAEQVVEGADPAAILATTFTRKAAAELKGRIQSRILECEDLPPDQRAAKCERLELAAIGTVHSVGHQLLRRYALHLGLSPSLEVLEEDAEQRALDDLMAAVAPEGWNRLIAATARFGIDDPRALVLKLLGAKRTNRIADSDFVTQLAASAESFCKLMAESGPDPTAPGFDDLYAAADQARQELEALTEDTTDVTRKAIRALHRLTTRRTREWRDFATAATMKAAKTYGAHALLEPLRELGRSVLTSPDLHADVRELLSLLADQTLAIGATYQAYKDERGLVDFNDLETLLLDLLDNPELRPSLAAEIDVVVVDEFQDTNPLQLAIFERLRRIARTSRWVGDAKQAIYGFRGTDPELVAGVWDAVPAEQRKSLPNNYRSGAGLVQLIGRLFEPVFGAEATLKPVRPAADRAVERWVVHGSRIAQDHAACAHGLATLNREGTRWGDMAVLTRSNAAAKDIAEACRARGIPAQLKVPGLLSTRECAVAVAALRLAADPRDSLAAATVLHLLEGQAAGGHEWLDHRLRERQAADAEKESGETAGQPLPFAGVKALEPLRGLSCATDPPTATVRRIISALRLSERVAEWGSAPQRSANLDTLVALTADYETEQRRRCAGATLTGLIAWLEDRAADEKDEIEPPEGINAVTISTYHSAKGLEWPVAVLTELGKTRDPNLFEPVVTGVDHDAHDPLAGRTLRYWPWPFGVSPFGKLTNSGTDLETMALDSPEGNEAAERDHAESLRLLYVGCTRARDKLVLLHREKKSAWLDALRVAKALLPEAPPDGWDEGRDDVKSAVLDVDGVDTRYVLRNIDGVAVERAPARKPSDEAWLGSPDSVTVPSDSTYRYHNPSSQSAEGLQATATVIEIPNGLRLPPKTDPDEGVRLGIGDAVHAYFGALPSLRHAIEAVRLDAARRSLEAHGAVGRIEPADLVVAGDAFAAWVDSTFLGATWLTEVPISSPREAGGQWRGTADLILDVPDGLMVLIDHKASRPANDRYAEAALKYVGQLAAYGRTLEGRGERVAQALIHLPLVGVAVDSSSMGRWF